MWRLMNCIQAFNWIRRCMMNMGMSIMITLSLIFDAAYVCSIIIGMPLVAFKLDRGMTHEDVQGGYTALLSLGGAFMIPFVMIVVGLAVLRDMPFGAMVASLILNMLQGMVLTIIKPAAKRLYGEGDWLFAAPSVLLMLECGQATLFLSLGLNNPQLYLLICTQLGCKCNAREKRGAAAHHRLRGRGRNIAKTPRARARAQTRSSRTVDSS